MASASALRVGVGGGIALLAAGGLATQAMRIETGHDSVFGLVPLFNPAGVRNVPVYAASAVLALSALWTAAAARLLRSRALPGARWWLLLAGVQAALSLQRLAWPRPRTGGDPAWLTLGYAAQPPWTAADVPLLAGIGVAVIAVGASLRTAVEPARARLAGGAALFGLGAILGASAGAHGLGAVAHANVAAAGASLIARGLELAGLAVFIAGVTRQIAALTPVLELRPSPRRVARHLALVIAGLCAASLLATWARTAVGPGAEAAYRSLNIDFEGNVPTWWSAMLLLSCGVVSGAIAAARRAEGHAVWPHWTALAVLCVFLSADEAAGLHELALKPLRQAFDTNGWLRYPLIVPGLVVATSVAMAFRRFVGSLGEPRRLLYVGAAIFAAGALGVETVGGWYAPEAVGESVTYVLLATLEEACEMTGVAVVLVGLLRCAAQDAGAMQFRLGPPGGMDPGC